jgi:ABC-type sugar transport system ATPase subunit
MSSVSFQGVRKRFGTTEVINNITLEVEDGEFLVFVGPSGCGKSTMLRMVAGLETISQGDLLIDGTRVNDLGPSERGAAMVFQSYALYPHMTVAENMGFGLRVAGLPKPEVNARVQQTAETLQITDLLARYPKQLSGGQRQRVAIGRAIVRRPKVFLFDEPLSNLDASLRVQLRIELAKLHASLGTTMIYVTHDQTEAMTLGDRIAVFNKGKIEQVGPPSELYENPTNRFVAEFLGTPKINIIPYEWLGNGALRFAGNVTVDAMYFVQEVTSLQRGNHLGIRPEHWELTAEGTGIPVKISLIEYLGDSTIVYANIEGSTDLITLKLSIQQSTHKAGDAIHIRPTKPQSTVFNREGNRIG